MSDVSRMFIAQDSEGGPTHEIGVAEKAAPRIAG